MQSKSSGAGFSRGTKPTKQKTGMLQSASPKPKRLSSSSREGAKTSGSSLREKLLRPNADGMVRISVEDLKSLPPRKTDWSRFDALTGEDIARAVSNDPDAAPIDLDWSNAKIYYPKGKLPVSLRVDADVFAFFKSNGRGYQTRMNAVLRSYVEHELGKKSNK
jgi:uncharacterized protein (DUF4415 family)